MNIETMRPEDAKIEKALNDLYIKHSFEPNYALSNIDYSGTMADQVRPGEILNPDVVDRYAIRYKDGSVAEAMIVLDQGKGKKSLLKDGIQRFNACKQAGVKHHPVFIAEPDTDMKALKLACHRINRGHGWTYTKEENIILAVEMVLADGFSATEAAKECQVQASVVTARVREQEFLNRTAKFGLNVRAKSIGRESQRRLQGIHSDVVFEPAVKMVLTRKPSDIEIGELVTSINDRRSEAEQLAFLKEKEETERPTLQRTASVGRRKPSSQESALYANLEWFIFKMDVGPLSQELVTSGNLPELPGLIRQAFTNLEKLLEATEVKASAKAN